MTVVRRTLTCPRSVATVQAMWFDVQGWAAWVDGFATLVDRDERWPRVGGRLVWQSTPHGRGRVTEVVCEQHDSAGYAATVSDPQMSGTQRVRFEAGGQDTHVTLELDYRLRRRRPGGFVIDLLFIRRAVGDSLARTLEAFAAELTAVR
jgi:polyketide cyclase/dehydrase/lipid transport protein